MNIAKAYKIELGPNNAQRTLLAKHSGTARFVWNWALARRIAEYKLTGKSSSAFTQHRQLNAAKPLDFPWMYEVSKCAPESSLRDLEQAFKNFFAKRARHPKFKSRKLGQGAFRLYGKIRIENDRIRLPRLGWIRLKESGYLPVDAKIISATVRERAGRWFVSVQVEEQVAVPENQGPAIGLDLGLNKFVVGSDGSSLEAPKPLARAMKRLRRLSRQHSKKQKGSANRKKSVRKLGRLHYRISCQRSDFLHKATTQLAKTKSVIVVESLNVNGMMQNRRLARSISDAGWSEFTRLLRYKCEWYGARLIEAGRFYPSSKTCSRCGEVKKSLPLGERAYRCETCGLELDRDLNAARNLLNLSTARSAGLKACGEAPTVAVCEAGTEQRECVSVSEIEFKPKV